MNPLRLLGLALGSLRRHAVRSALTLLGVVIGVGAVVVMMSIGAGAQAEIESRIAGLGTHLVMVTPGASTTSGASGGAGSQASLTMDDVEALRREALLLDKSSPVITTFSNTVAGKNNWRSSVAGVDLDFFVIRNWGVSSGRLFEPQDMTSSRKVCLLGATVARMLFGEEDAVGRTVRIRNIPMEVVGVLEAKGQSAAGADQDDMVVLPYTTVRARMAGRQFISQILLSAASGGEVPLLMEEARGILQETHRVRPGSEDFTLQDQAQLTATAQETTQIMTSLLLTVANVSLLVGGIGIMNMMLVSVTERTREIGIRRAVGARRRDILSQFLVEAAVLSGLGGVLGLGLGVVGAQVVGEWTGWSTPIPGMAMAVSMGFSVGIGVCFGIYPAWKAARMDPIEALRFQ